MNLFQSVKMSLMGKKMNIGKMLKKCNDLMPDLLKRFLAPMIRRRLIRNRVFLEQYSLLDTYNNLSTDEKNEILLQETKKILIYSYKSVPYYKRVFDQIGFDPENMVSLKELEQLPILNKALVIENFDDLMSSENISAYKTSTGGSSGKPLTVYQDVNAVYKQKAFVYHYWSSLGYNFKKSKIASFRGVEFGSKISKYNPIDNVILMSPFRLNESSVEQYVCRIEKFGAEFLHGYPSALLNLAKLMVKKKLSFSNSIAGVFFASENLDTADQLYIEKVFNCRSLVFYGHTERAVFAEMVEGSYSFNPNYGYTELIDDGNGKFDIACTGFLNKKMPLIRYMPDDKISCTDGKYLVHGHNNKDALYGKNGEQITMTSINFHSDTFKKIKCFQFEQSAAGEAILKIVAAETVSVDDKKNMLKVLDKKIKGLIKITIKIVDNIPLTKSGKFERILQHLKVD